MIVRNHVFLVLTVFVTYFNSLCLGYHLFPHSNVTLSRYRRQSDCNPPRVRCGDGTCIPPFKVCDGVSDCSDGADEFNNCNTGSCEDWAFRCKYSACIDGDKRCDGKPDCRDGSDEEGCGGSTNTGNKKCGTQFSCATNNQCLPYYKVCDGKADCKDSSDETFENCKNTQCPEHAFQCNYGACVDGEFRCNTQVDCADGSDEDPVLCGSGTTQKPTSPQPPLSNGFCSVPIIENGNYLVKGTQYVQGTPIPNLSIVMFSCNQHYALYPKVSVAFCNDGTWNTKLPECRQTCSPRISTSVDVTCTIDGATVSCNEPVVEGTVAKSKCKHFYTSADAAYFPTSRCSGGSWDNPLIRCIPECGEVVPKGVTNIVNGVAAKKGEFPWHIALYLVQGGNYEYKCGGSLVTPLIVISAAHCFTTEYGVQEYPTQNYYIGAGKYYSAYNAPGDKLAQLRQVKEIHIPPLYRGYENNFAADLVVIIVQKSFQLTNVVQPVCVDWNKEFERDQLRPDTRGSVVGWGYVDPKKPTASEELKQLTAPYIETGACLNVVPQDFIRWVTSDKFCAGLTNGSSVCLGDSGGGMVFPRMIHLNKVKYYIRGIVSVGPTTETGICDNHQYGVYTLVSQYSDFIQDIIATHPVVD